MIKRVREAGSASVAWIPIALLIYLFLVGISASAIVALNFPKVVDERVQFFGEPGPIEFVPAITVRSTDQALVVLAFMAGVAGSFLHAAQSLTTYVGNDRFKTSWAAWYVMRPWIGGVLGFTLYFAFRAGLVSAASGLNPFGVVAIGVLGGWFSKTTTDKLQEVFNTLFKTDADRERNDKLQVEGQPVISDAQPRTVTGGTATLALVGRNFLQGASLVIGDQEVPANVASPTHLTVDLSLLRPMPPGEVSVVVRNPSGDTPESEAFMVTFDAR